MFSLPRAAMLLLLATLLQAAMVLGGGNCPKVPGVSGMDQSPTSPNNYGKCTSALEKGPWASKSHWCNSQKPFKAWPGPPSSEAQKCLKFGRTTIYRGPMYGSSTEHKAACNKVGVCTMHIG